MSIITLTIVNCDKTRRQVSLTLYFYRHPSYVKKKKKKKLRELGPLNGSQSSRIILWFTQKLEITIWFFMLNMLHFFSTKLVRLLSCSINCI